MPELPEVETIRLGLLPRLKKRVIAQVEVHWHKTFNADAEYIATHVAGSMVKDITRRGKVLIVHLNNGHALLFHLKMTGQLILESKNKKANSAGWRIGGGHPTKSMEGELPDTSTRVIFTFANGDKLFFNDQRKFGWVKLVLEEEVASESLIAKMGPEPMQKGFELHDFINRVQRRHAPIKAVLLDQSTLAGLGNIYVDEALHLAKIHPSVPASTLIPRQLSSLFDAIKTVLALSINHGGTSFTSYVNALGVKGDYLQHARVFRRTDEPCPTCGKTIEKIRVAGRGTHICPNCQKAPRNRRK